MVLAVPLAETFPALYCHCIQDALSVRDALNHSLDDVLRPRLTQAAAQDKLLLQNCLQHLTLKDEPDSRFLTLWPSECFNSSSAYRATHTDDAPDPDAIRFWDTKLPSKIRFFGWLLHCDRLNTRANMLRRNICKQEESSCECCPGTLETSEHIFVSCPCARAVWSLLGIAVGDGMHQQPWLLGCELQPPHSVQADVMLLVLWQIWKARNALIFDRATSLPTDVLRRRTIKGYGLLE